MLPLFIVRQGDVHSLAALWLAQFIGEDMAEFKVGTIFRPKADTIHFNRYGKFIGRVSNVEADRFTWYVIDEGNGVSPVVMGNAKTNTSLYDLPEFEDITDLYNSPLYQALL